MLKRILNRLAVRLIAHVAISLLAPIPVLGLLARIVDFMA